MKTEGFFVGVGLLEDLVKTHRRRHPMYVELVAERQGSQIGIHGELQVLIVADVQDGVCRYWRKLVARHELIAGRPTDELRWTAQRSCAAACLEAVKEYVKKEITFGLDDFDYPGGHVLAATVAMPRDLRLLDGDTKLLRFNRDVNAFEPVHPATAET